jgi:3-oxoacyl-[acyl-carrier protein] reductase
VLLGAGFDLQPWQDGSEGFGRPLRTQDLPAEGDKAHALVLDATGARTVAELKDLYTLGHASVRKLRRCGRIVVVGRPPDSMADSVAVAVQRALVGFAKALAKELGAKGITSNVLEVAAGAEERLAGPLGFLLSDRSAFVTAQTLAVNGRVDGAGGGWSVRPLDGMVALVTGAARGIGKATAVRLAEEGAKVFVLDRPDDTGGLDEVARSVGGVAVSADITEDGAAATILEAVGDSGLDIVVHNAGVTRDKTLGRMDDARWDLVMAVNLQAIISLEAAFAEAGALNRGGQTIVMSSIAGIAGNMGQSNYAASKAALVGWVAAEAPLRAGKGRGVNAVAPGFIETRLTAAIPVATREGARRLAALSQGGLPIDIAEAVVFLASGAGLGITGRTLRVCGGNFIGA